VENDAAKEFTSFSLKKYSEIFQLLTCCTEANIFFFSMISQIKHMNINSLSDISAPFRHHKHMSKQLETAGTCSQLRISNQDKLPSGKELPLLTAVINTSGNSSGFLSTFHTMKKRQEQAANDREIKFQFHIKKNRKVFCSLSTGALIYFLFYLDSFTTTV